MVSDKLTALDTETGDEKWKFYASGPIRYAPVGYKDKIYVGSDDGLLYCLDAKTGKVLRTFYARPSGRLVLGHERLISCWPISGGPALMEGKIYFAAGSWPFEGTFIYALNADTGKVIWLNDESESLYVRQAKRNPAFAGPTPFKY